MAIASLVLGIVCLVFCFIPVINFIAPILGIVGIILGALSLKQLKESGQPAGMAIGGLVTSIVATVLSVFIWIACAACMGGLSKKGADLQKNPKKLEESLKQFEKLGKDLEKKSK